MKQKNTYNIALLKEGLGDWGEEIVPWLMSQPGGMVLAENLDELMALLTDLSVDNQPEIILLCHRPGIFDGVAAAAVLQKKAALTPLLFLAEENQQHRSDVQNACGLALIPPPFSPKLLSAAVKRCQHKVEALRRLKVQHRHDRLQAELFRRAPCAHWYVDVEGIIRCANREAERMFGLNRNSTVAMSEILQSFFATHASTHPQELEEAICACAPWKGHLQIRTVPLGTRIFHVESRPVNLPEITGTHLILHDIHNEKNIQDRLNVERQAARDALFLATGSAADPQLNELCTTSCFIALRAENFSLKQLLHELGQISSVAPAEVAFPDYLPEVFYGDRLRLKYALQMMLHGSAGFGEKAPTISISIKGRTPQSFGLQFYLRAENRMIVKDSYQTVADYLAAVQDDSSASSGLGLAALLLQQLGGNLVVRTERGRARILVGTVPLAPSSPDTQPWSQLPPDDLRVPPSLSARLSQLKVLVAEDNPLEQATLRQILESLGCEVVIVNSGKAAVEESELGDFDIILMDILMPNMDGFEATRLIRERERTSARSIPVIALTSHALKPIQDKCVAVGMDGYLAKPVAKNKLIEALKNFTLPPLASASADAGTASPLAQRIAGDSGVRENYPVLDSRPVLENLDQDLETYRELVEMYLSGFVTMGDELADMLADGELEEILNNAHGLKGVASNLGGLQLAEVARQIQDLCREGRVPDPLEFSSRLREASAAFKAALEAIDWQAAGVEN
jgi:CheY-like chemotaxis protein/HPt (histidine-containing phosphotransfer) domain-containing protein